MITRYELNFRSAHVCHSGAKRRPSWCYGTAGIARTLQLAALSIGDTNRRRIAEDTLMSALTDPAQRTVTTDASLCHGYAGLARITAHTADDAADDAATRLRALVPDLLDRAVVQPATTAPGLLEGAAGIALAALAPTTGVPTATRWDTFLLIA
jgi:hypothetical protein